jgi:aerobic carbon-monoxide dehydrogenase small subunit
MSGDSCITGACCLNDTGDCNDNHCETKKISFTLNGELKCFTVSPNEKLLTLLRRNGYIGTKYGCGEGTCGTCTVLFNGNAAYSCILYVFQVDGGCIETIEGVANEGELHDIQKALVDEGAVQCGYCIPGIVMSAKSLFSWNKHPSEECIKVHMDGNLCRCTGYEKILSALKKVADK